MSVKLISMLWSVLIEVLKMRFCVDWVDIVEKVRNRMFTKLRRKGGCVLSAQFIQYLCLYITSSSSLRARALIWILTSKSLSKQLLKFFVNRKKSDFPRFSLDCEVNLMWKSFFIGNDVTHWVVIVVVNDNVVNFFSGFSRIYITCNWLTVDWISAVLIFTLEAIPTPCIRNRIGSIWASIKIHYGWISGISGSWIVCCVI